MIAAKAQAFRRGGFAAGEEALNECRRASLLREIVAGNEALELEKAPERRLF
jgi:hypothetical protein